MRTLQWSIIALAFITIVNSTAHAQGPNRPGLNPYPTVSPYVNLLNNRGGNPAINYYGMVRPQFAFRGAVQQLQQGIQANQDAFVDLQTANAGYPETGHAAGFQTQVHYFMNTGGQRTGAPQAPAPNNAPAQRPAVKSAGTR